MARFGFAFALCLLAAVAAQATNWNSRAESPASAIEPAFRRPLLMLRRTMQARRLAPWKDSHLETSLVSVAEKHGQREKSEGFFDKLEFSYFDIQHNNWKDHTMPFFFPDNAPWTADKLQERLTKFLEASEFDIRQNSDGAASFGDKETTIDYITVSVSQQFGGDAIDFVLKVNEAVGSFQIVPQQKLAHIGQIFGRGFPGNTQLVFTGTTVVRIIDAILRILRVETVHLSDASKMGCAVPATYWQIKKGHPFGDDHSHYIVEVALKDLNIWITPKHQNWYNGFGFEADLKQRPNYCTDLNQHIGMTLEQVQGLQDATLKPHADKANEIMTAYLAHLQSQSNAPSQPPSSASMFEGCAAPKDPHKPLVADLTACLDAQLKRRLKEAKSSGATADAAYLAPPVVSACEALHTWVESFLTPFTEHKIQPTGNLYLHFSKVKAPNEMASWSC